MVHNQKGNVLVYILLAVALLAALTYAVSSDNRGNQTNQLTKAQAKLMAADLIAHATAAQMAVDQMTQWGVDYNEILFDKPGDPGYNSTTSQQLHHPSGGGLTPFQPSDTIFDDNGTTGWALQGNVNIGWSRTTATDLIYSFINVNDRVCAAINNDLNGDETIPSSSVDFIDSFTEDGSNLPFIASECAACENVNSLCITDDTTNAFYTILGMR